MKKTVYNYKFKLYNDNINETAYTLMQLLIGGIKDE